jgi:hypothetical protein
MEDLPMSRWESKESFELPRLCFGSLFSIWSDLDSRKMLEVVLWRMSFDLLFWSDW